ncbi:MAG: Imidazoleglycerol-phosphate dehydratase [Clostridiales bacterium 38_11]|nr:MAG: Imidazoleglycerol-phosphate dehydratase [Clostridiales bacterium 38_11]HBH12373.1 imidazoleglycerol-phosphate dehydratase HisB [Clostridiales bacterium]
MRASTVERKTLETDIFVALNIDGTGQAEISTGIGFFDHMLTLMAFHGKFDLTIRCQGDLEVDTHHTVEDIGLALGQAFLESLNDKKGIRRYANAFIPMDESLARVVLDISNRPYLIYKADLKKDYLGQMDTQNFEEFLRAFVMAAKLTLHVEVLYGNNDHHKIEAVFKALGRVLSEASDITGDRISSSKGVL